MLHSIARLENLLVLSDWLEQVADERMLTVLPLDIATVLALDSFPRSSHGDQADRLIVATARLRDMALATHDAKIRCSRVVSL